MARHKTKIKTWVKALIFLVVVGSLSGLLYFKVFNKETNTNKSNTNNTNNNAKPKEVKETKKVYKLSMVMGGDALIHSNVFKDAQKSDGTFDFYKQQKYVIDYIKQFDLRYYNQETIIGGDDRGYSGYPRFNTPSAFADTMRDIGFNMVSLANNHSMDQGVQGVLNSVNYWKNTDVMWNGQADSEETRTNYIIKEKNNITYAMLSYTEHTNGLPLPSDKPYLVNVWDDEKVKADVEYLRDKVDVLIVAMHWGEEYTHVPTQSERTKAQFLADLGVDIVIGAHPHVVQPIEKIGNTVIYYSLGNYLSNQIEDYKRVGLLGTLNITKTVENGESKIEISDVGGALIFTWRHVPSYSGHIIIPFTNSEIAKYLTNYESNYEKFKNIVTGGNDEYKIEPLFSQIENTEG